MASHKVVTYLLNILMNLESEVNTAYPPKRPPLFILQTIMQSDQNLASASVFYALRPFETDLQKY